MNTKLIYSQGILELGLLILNPSYKIIIYRIVMLYLAFKNDKHLLKTETNPNNKKKDQFNLGIQQILITFGFFILHNQPHFVLKEFIGLSLMHMVILSYPKRFTLCESYALSTYIIEYFQFNGVSMFEYLSEIVLMLAFASFIIIVLLSKIPIKELAFAFTFVAIFKLNFFSIYYYLQFRGDSLALLIGEIFSSEFGYYFGIQFCCLLLVIPINYFRGPNIIVRKLFHFQILLIVVIGIYFNRNYTKLALAVFIWLFVVLEGLRQYYKKDVTFLNSYSKFVENFCDQRDNHELIITHLYLLMGISHSVFLSANPYIGVILLGGGDALAAIIGSKFGKIKFQNSRTLEGSLAFLLTCSLLEYFLNGKIRLWVIATIIEAYTAQIDNLILPKIQLNPVLMMFEI